MKKGFISPYLILFITGVLLLILHFVMVKESFEDSTKEFEIFKKHPIDYYVITMGKENRLENIRNQAKKLNNNTDSNYIKINNVDAVKGDDLDLNKLVEIGKLKPSVIEEDSKDGFTKISNRKYEVGCFLSHVKIFSDVTKMDKERYTVIFEDDFDILPEFIKVMNQTMKEIKEKNIDFDILCLGLITKGKEADKITENIRKTACDPCFGSHAYMIPNKKADNILEKVSYINQIYDVKLFGKSNGLTVLRIEPDIVNQLSGIMGSEVRF